MNVQETLRATPIDELLLMLVTSTDQLSMSKKNRDDLRTVRDNEETVYLIQNAIVEKRAAENPGKKPTI